MHSLCYPILIAVGTMQLLPTAIVTVCAMCSLEKRGRQEYKHSAAQSEERQRAADELIRQQFGWLGPFAGMFARNMEQGSSSVANDEPQSRSHVGRRKRSVKPPPSHQRGTIPIERSLVHVPKKD